MSMAEFFYLDHYRRVISRGLTEDQKRDLAHKISELTLREPIWLNRDKDYVEENRRAIDWSGKNK